MDDAVLSLHREVAGPVFIITEGKELESSILHVNLAYNFILNGFTVFDSTFDLE